MRLVNEIFGLLSIVVSIGDENTEQRTRTGESIGCSAHRDLIERNSRVFENLSTDIFHEL